MLFSEYMNAWLYGDTGYYVNYKAIGKGGDFYTAVSTSRFFGASIANYLLKLIEEDASKAEGTLVEIGAHKGYLICDIIHWLYTKKPELLKSMHFVIIEKHEALIQAQKEYISSMFGDAVQVEHKKSLREVDAPYVFAISNEIFDAFPCELLKDGKIAAVKEHAIEWIEAPKEMLLWAKSHRLIQGEVAVGYEAFAKEVASLQRCDFVSFDYGEAYVRNDFSIRLYKEHEVYPLFDENVDLSTLYQNADITYDVNFAHVLEAFETQGFKKRVYETQARALVRFGLMEMLEEFILHATSEVYAREVDKIKTLIAPTIMGDRFKMIHLEKS
ncbi:MAG: SAM-dependent methyltransferase [Sulfurovaceae bacterium]